LLTIQILFVDLQGEKYATGLRKLTASKGDRAYIRNGVAGWPVERQRQALAEVGFDGPIYEDTLTRAHLRGRNVAALEQRADMLRPTSRTTPEVILVSSIRVLALSPVDLTVALASASARHATIRALDTGLEIAPDAGAAQIAAAAAAWDKARRDDQTRDARGKGNEAAVRAAERRREAGLAIARPLWGLPSETMPAAEIAKRSGLSVGTLYRFLDRRTPAQRSAKAAQAKAIATQTDLEDFTGPLTAAKRKGKPNGR
jgi:DNA invertase Pin-like site-specific DNA recombinase